MTDLKPCPRLAEAAKILDDYAQRDSCIDSGNLYFAACVFRDALRVEQLNHRAAEVPELSDALHARASELDYIARHAGAIVAGELTFIAEKLRAYAASKGKA